MIGIKDKTLREILREKEWDQIDLDSLYDIIMEGCIGWKKMSPITISDPAVEWFDLKFISYSTDDDWHWFEVEDITETEMIEDFVSLMGRDFTEEEITIITKEEYDKKGYKE